MKLLLTRIQTCLLGMTLDLSWKRILAKWPLKPRRLHFHLVLRTAQDGPGTVVHVCIAILLIVCDTRSLVSD